MLWVWVLVLRSSACAPLCHALLLAPRSCRASDPCCPPSPRRARSAVLALSHRPPNTLRSLPWSGAMCRRRATRNVVRACPAKASCCFGVSGSSVATGLAEIRFVERDTRRGPCRAPSCASHTALERCPSDRPLENALAPRDNIVLRSSDLPCLDAHCSGRYCEDNSCWDAREVWMALQREQGQALMREKSPSWAVFW